MDMVRLMMSYTNLPVSFWGYALQTAAYLLNRVPSKSVPKTPYEMWFGRKPSLNHLKIWGCSAYVKKHDIDKLDARSEMCRFIGYLKETLGYYFSHPNEQKVLVARSARFLEIDFALDGTCVQKVELKEEFGEPHEPEVQSDPVDNPVPLPTLTQPPRRSERTSKAPDRYLGLHHVLLMGDDMEDPETYTKAMLDIDSKKWQEAMRFEMDSMYTNQVWTLVYPPEGIVPIGNKWVLKRKKGSYGMVETYKARLMAKGYRQREGIDYEETFSHVALM
ncbi:unnamed protein product, partial [Prunus brigantina]